MVARSSAFELWISENLIGLGARRSSRAPRRREAPCAHVRPQNFRPCSRRINRPAGKAPKTKESTKNNKELQNIKKALKTRASSTNKRKRQKTRKLQTKQETMFFEAFCFFEARPQNLVPCVGHVISSNFFNEFPGA